MEKDALCVRVKAKERNALCDWPIVMLRAKYSKTKLL